MEKVAVNGNALAGFVEVKRNIDTRRVSITGDGTIQLGLDLLVEIAPVAFDGVELRVTDGVSRESIATIYPHGYISDLLNVDGDALAGVVESESFGGYKLEVRGFRHHGAAVEGEVLLQPKYAPTMWAKFSFKNLRFVKTPEVKPWS